MKREPTKDLFNEDFSFDFCEDLTYDIETVLIGVSNDNVTQQGILNIYKIISTEVIKARESEENEDIIDYYDEIKNVLKNKNLRDMDNEEHSETLQVLFSTLCTVNSDVTDSIIEEILLIPGIKETVETRSGSTIKYIKKLTLRNPVVNLLRKVLSLTKKILLSPLLLLKNKEERTADYFPYIVMELINGDMFGFQKMVKKLQ